MMGKDTAKEAEHRQLEAESLVEAARERYNGVKATVTSSRGSERQMPTQVYRCPELEHEDFERTVPVGHAVPRSAPCPVVVTCDQNYEHPCSRLTIWVPSVPNFIGGPTTGARKREK